jgi:hypothetical protein
MNKENLKKYVDVCLMQAGLPLQIPDNYGIGIKFNLKNTDGSIENVITFNEGRRLIEAGFTFLPECYSARIYIEKLCLNNITTGELEYDEWNLIKFPKEAKLHTIDTGVFKEKEMLLEVVKSILTRFIGNWEYDINIEEKIGDRK